MASGFGAPPGQPAGYGTPQQSFGTPPGGQSFGTPPGGQPYGAPMAQQQAIARPHAGGAILSADGVEKARSLRWWMKLFGILNMVFGGIYCASIAGAMVGWLPILIGYWTMKAGDGIGTFAETGDGMSLENAIRSLRNIYLTMGITFLVGVGLGVLFAIIYVVLVIGVLGAGAAMGNF